MEVPPPDDDAPADWDEQYEYEYGISDYDERRDRLSTYLDLIQENVRIDHRAVVAAVQRAKRAQLDANISGWALDHRREHAKRLAQARVHVEKAVALIVALRRELNPNDLPITAAQTEQYEAILSKLKTDPLLHFPGPYRRKGRRPARPWIGEARKSAKAAGASRAVVDAMLQDVGLLPLPND